MRSGKFTYIGENKKVFLPNQLPPDPKLHIDSELRTLLSDAEKALLVLEGALGVSSEEDLNPLFLFELINSLGVDDDEISFEDYFAAKACGGGDFAERADNLYLAFRLGLRLLKDVGRSSHIFKSVHSEMNKSAGGNDAADYRDSQTTFGNGAGHFPPPPGEIPRLMNELENYIATDISYPVLINAALIHAQFEMIHPFASGNGTIGRLLFLLHLKWKGVLAVPAITISYALRLNRLEYFDKLSELEINGSWEDWIKFFLRMIAASAKHTTQVLYKKADLGRGISNLLIEKNLVSPASVELQRLLFVQPVVTIPFLTESLRFTKQTANATVTKFREENILKETTGHTRNRIFVLSGFFESFDYQTTN